MLKYLRLLCKLPEYLKRDFRIKKSAQENKYFHGKFFCQCLFMRYVFSKELNTFRSLLHQFSWRYCDLDTLYMAYIL